MLSAFFKAGGQHRVSRVETTITAFSPFRYGVAHYAGAL